LLLPSHRHLGELLPRLAGVRLGLAELGLAELRLAEPRQGLRLVVPRLGLRLFLRPLLGWLSCRDLAAHAFL
jgi:hypothetical protein